MNIFIIKKEHLDKFNFYICIWRNVTKEEMEIRCGKLERGEIGYGTLIETGLPEQKKLMSGKTVSVEIDGEKYTAIIQ